MKKRTFDFENGFTFDIAKRIIKRNFPRRAYTAYKRDGKAYCFKINLTDDEITALTDELTDNELKVTLSDDKLTCNIGTVYEQINFSVITADDNGDTKTREYTAHCRHTTIVIESKTTDFQIILDASGIELNRASYERFINLWASEYWTGKNGAHLLISTSLGYKNENRVINAGFTMRNECKFYNEYIIKMIERWARHLGATELSINNMGECTLMCNDGAICDKYVPDLQEIIVFNQHD